MGGDPRHLWHSCHQNPFGPLTPRQPLSRRGLTSPNSFQQQEKRSKVEGRGLNSLHSMHCVLQLTELIQPILPSTSHIHTGRQRSSLTTFSKSGTLQIILQTLCQHGLLKPQRGGIRRHRVKTTLRPKEKIVESRTHALTPQRSRACLRPSSAPAGGFDYLIRKDSGGLNPERPPSLWPGPQYSSREAGELVSPRLTGFDPGGSRSRERPQREAPLP